MPKVTGRVLAAGRALAGISREDFAQAAGLSVARLRRLESKGSAEVTAGPDVDGILAAFDRFGVVPLDEDGDMGAGVRLKFTRQDVRQIVRLEGEGGIVGSDDYP